ncbi:DUF3592 domain-containing protein [Azoarcus olearius]|uniref:Conserved hypothetical membrane protein n=1 Tax=Azoarcus sp. (strain BH72) TaxID=418699 RepID=A1KC36_AZOSB|nr:DUF3592 domain-containing protein [Azoarcus olearius]ANQ86944.1 hypothetical protein dqs_3927 [Azoarcus olearius]CAL96392.1 conserved hypothetical membrane protein [Azoarcus olearius]
MRGPSLRQYLLEALLRAAVPLVGVSLLVAGVLGVVSFGVLPMVDAMRSRQWLPVEARLEWVRAEPAAPMRIRPLPAIRVSYQYSYGGADYVGRRTDLHHGLNTPAAVARRLSEVRESEPLVAWVNPAAPEQAMLDRSIHVAVVVLALPSALLALVGGLAVFLGMVAWNDWRLPRTLARPDSLPPPATQRPLEPPRY